MSTLPCLRRGAGRGRRKAQGGQWGIVLAGGDGKRVRPLTRAWLGENRPKQYCTFTGSRSMLQHTLDRASSWFDPDKMVTVIARDHREYWSDAVPRSVGHVVEQPSNRGTAAGVLFPLSIVLNQDPDATVFVLPSDHFLYPERRFHQYVTEAMHLAETYKEGLVLIGASPDRAEPDYGWIRPGFVAAQSRIRRRSFMVRGFCEKPSRSVSERLFEDGWLWNTMMLAVKARVLWNIAQATIGNIVERFETFGKVVHAVYEGRVPFDHMDIAADHIYADLPTTDLSRDIIQPAAEQRLVEPIVLPIKDIQWSDWGRPERIVSTLSKLPGYDRGLLFDRDLSWDLVGKRFEMEKDAVATC